MSDGLWSYKWDAENRLVRQTSTLPSTGAFEYYDRLQLTFAYDWQGRRVRKEVENLRTSTVKSARRYVYDGWNLIAEFDESGTLIGALQRSYTWGLDQTGSLDATGGVGALVQLSVHAGATVTDYYPACDANGNVAALVKSDGTLAAAYEYDPFGQSLRNDVLDSAVADNPFRFSTKFTDVETGLVYYGQRYYSPGLGRFINKDPMAEQGGLNLYAFVGNDPVNRIDVLGTNSNLPYYGYGRYGLGYYDDPSQIWDPQDDTGSISYVQNGPVLGGGGGGGGSSTNQTTSNKTQDAPKESPCGKFRARIQQAKVIQAQNAAKILPGGVYSGGIKLSPADGISLSAGITGAVAGGAVLYAESVPSTISLAKNMQLLTNGSAVAEVGRIGGYTAGSIAIAADTYSLFNANNSNDATLAGGNLATDMALIGGRQAIVSAFGAGAVPAWFGPVGLALAGIQLGINIYVATSIKADSADTLQANAQAALRTSNIAKAKTQSLEAEAKAAGC